MKILSYINPFLVDASEKPGYKKNHFQEAKENNYLLRDTVTGDVIQGGLISFGAAMIDFS